MPTLLSTRPWKEKDPLLQAITALGIKVLPCPMFDIKPTQSRWTERLPPLISIQDAIFTSPNAVLHFFHGLEKNGIAWPCSVHITAIGTGTAQQLKNMHIRVDYIPNQANSETLLAMEHFQHISRKKIILVKGMGGRRLIPNTLWKRDADLSIINVYKRCPRKEFSNLEGAVADIILFTSEQGMRHFLTLAKNTCFTTTPCLVISPRLATIAHDLGFKTILTSSIDSLVETLHHFKQGLTNDRT